MYIFQVTFKLGTGIVASSASNTEHASLPTLVYCADLGTVMSKVAALELQYWVLQSIIQTSNRLLQ